MRNKSTETAKDPDPTEKPARKRKERPINLYQMVDSCNPSFSATCMFVDGPFESSELARKYVAEKQLEGQFEVHAVHDEFDVTIETKKVAVFK